MSTTPTRSMSVTAVASQGRAVINIVDTISTQTEASSKLLGQKVGSFLSMGIRTAEVYINSDGGNVFEAVEIVNQLNRFGAANVRITVGAMAASAATYITSSFHTEAESEASRLMIHFPQSTSYGTASELRTQVRLLESIEDEYCGKYASKTGKSKEAIRQMLDKGDVWMTASEALANGFIDGIKGGAKAPAPAPSMAPVAVPAERATAVIAARAGGMLTPEQAADIWERTAAAREKDPGLEQTIREGLCVAMDDGDRGMAGDGHVSMIRAAHDIWERTAAAREKDPGLGVRLSGQLSEWLSSAPVAVTYGEKLAERATGVETYLDGDISAYEKLWREDPYQARRLEYDYFRRFPNGNNLSEKQEKNVLKAMGGKTGWTLEDYLTDDFDGYQGMRDAHPELARILEHAEV